MDIDGYNKIRLSNLYLHRVFYFKLFCTKIVLVLKYLFTLKDNFNVVNFALFPSLIRTHSITHAEGWCGLLGTSQNAAVRATKCFCIEDSR